MTTQLSASGYATDLACDVAQAERLLAHRHYDLIAIDLDLPDSTAYQLIAQIRSSDSLKGLPVLVITGPTDTKACSRAFDAGATGFTTKPINWDLLAEHISYVLRNAEREAALVEARDAAECAMALRDNLLNVVGHELRTPLNAVIGFARILQDEVLGPLGAKEYGTYVREIADAGQQLNGIVRDALLTSRLVTGNQTADVCDYDTGEIIKPVVREQRMAAELRQTQIDLTRASFDLTINCDPTLVQTALGHLIRNAIDHTPEGSSASVVCYEDGGQTCLGVIDNGPGIDEARLELLANPLVQGDAGLTRTSSGLGFGLSIAKSVAELHGGRLQLSNEPSGGLRAILRLPVLPHSEDVFEAQVA